MQIALSPYLNFNGQAKGAMEFYQSVLGGELSMQTYEQSGQTSKPQENDLIMHAELKNDFLSFMASDGNAEHVVHFGDNIHMSLMGDDETKLTEIFNKLSEGGQVDMPLKKEFWGDTFGMFTDKFGVHWMVNISSPK